MISKAEIDVEVLVVRDESLYLTDGDTSEWVPISLLDEESEIDADTEVGVTGTLVIPQWKAEELGWV